MASKSGNYAAHEEAVAKIKQIVGLLTLAPQASRSEAREKGNEELRVKSEELTRLARTAARIVGAFRGGEPVGRSEVRLILAAGVGPFTAAAEASVERFARQDEEKAGEGLQSIVRGINQPVLILIELTASEMPAMLKSGALKRLVSVAAGAAMANKFIAVEWVVPPEYEGRLRQLIHLEKANKNDPVQIMPASKGFILHHREFPKNFSLLQATPALAIRPESGETKLTQLDPNTYGKGIGKISVKDRDKVFAEGLLFLADPLSQKTEKIIVKNSRNENLHYLAGPFALPRLGELSSLLARTRRLTATAA